MATRPDVELRPTEVRFAGIGGQGIVLAGRLLGEAAVLFEGKEAVCTQSYGPEARGGASRTDVIIADEPIDYPFVTSADVLAAFFQEAYLKFADAVADDGMIVVDTGLVSPREDDTRISGLPATEIAEQLGSRLAANVVMLGYIAARTGIVSRDALENAIRAHVRPSVVELDLKALDAGIDYAERGADV